ncbi:MAG: DUF6097 family protein [Acinetobacter sp.]
MGNLIILGKPLENSEVLKNIQNHITDNHFSIPLKDKLNKQVVEVENYFGDHEYQKLEEKKNKINIWTAVLAFPVLIYCISLFFSHYANNIGINIDVSLMNQMLFDGVIKYLWAIILYGVVFFGLIFYFYILNNQSKQQIVKTVNKLLSQSSI